MMAAGALALAAACSESEPEISAAQPAPEAEPALATEPAAPAETAEAGTPDGLSESQMAHAQRLESSTADITEQDFADRVAILADDRFEGRAPGTPAGEASAQWIADEMARIGLEPAFDGSWFQTVPLVSAELEPGSTMTITGPDGEIPLSRPDQTVFNSSQLQPEISIDGSEVIFAGYGAVAPEYDWDDYAGFDPAGKTVIVLVNDPGFATGDPDLFTGNAMTYYGRWTYKYEEAGRQGVDSILIVHETAPAAYGWDVVRNSWSGPQFYLESDAPRAAMEGWITADKAREIFAAAGQDYDALKEAAAQPGFTAVPLDGVTLDAHILSDVQRLESRNVGGVVPGAQRPDETIIYTGHWDHLGLEPDAAPGEDAIYNGAVDNATGVATILEIGEAFARGETPPDRSVMILAVTAEESGLLGSDYFAANPTLPLKNIVADINIDAMMPSGMANDMIVIGAGASELEDILQPIVEAHGRVTGPDPQPQNGSFYRSDHISFAKRGVPALYSKAGEDLVDGGPEAGRAASDDYRAGRYHGVEDEYDPETWNFDGMIDDTQILFEVGSQLANSDAWPNWYDGNEFRSLRDAQLADGG